MCSCLQIWSTRIREGPMAYWRMRNERAKRSGVWSRSESGSLWRTSRVYIGYAEMSLDLMM